MPIEAIKIKVNADELDAKLSKSMQELGAHHDQYGRLLNAEEKYIGSLSQANVRMGYYIDSQGKMRDANGRLVEGLSAAEKALRMYIDAHGDVRTAEGEFVRASDAKVKALEESRKAAASTLSNLSQLSSSMTMLASVFTRGGKEGSAFAKTMEDVTAGTAAVLGYAGAAVTLTNSLRNLAKTKALVSGFSGALTLSTLAIAGWVYAFSKFAHEQSDTDEILKKEIDSIKRLSDVHDALQRKIAQYGPLNAALSMSQSSQIGNLDVLKETENMLKQRRDLVSKEFSQWSKIAAKEEQKLEYESSPYDIRQYFPMFSSTLNDIFNKRMVDAQERRDRAAQKLEELKNAIQSNNDSQYNSLLQMFKSDIDKDPMRELAERAKLYAGQLSASQIKAENLGTAQEALTNVYRKYADAFKIDSPQKLDEAIQRAAKDFGETSEAYKTVVQNLRESYSKNRLEKSSGYIESLREQMKTPMDRLREEQAKLKEAYHAGAVSFHELAEMNQFLRDKYAEKVPEVEKPEKDDWKVEEYRAPQSLEYGSQKLYEVLTQRGQDPWRDKMQSELAAMRGQNDEANEYLRDMRDGILAFNDIGVTA